MVVEADGEVVQVIVEGLLAHVGAEAPLVLGSTVVAGCAPVDAGEVDVDVHGEAVAESIVQTRNHADAESGVVVTILDGGTGHFATIHEGMGFAFETQFEVDGSFAEDVEFLPFEEVVAEVGVDHDGVAGTGGVAVFGTHVVTGVVVVPAKLCTDLHVVVQLIADLGHDGDSGVGVVGVSGGGDETSVVLIVVALVVESHVATDNELSIGGECECCESKGQKNFFHFF